MTAAFDNRLLNVQITIEGRTITYDQEYYIIASGTRYSGGNFGECTLRLDNISKTDRDFIISKTTLWSNQRSLVQVVINAGRESYGTFEVFSGTVVSANITQPPDIGLVLKCANGAAVLGYTNAFAAAPQATFKSICQQVANNITAAQPTPPTVLDFQSSQGGKLINNYNFTGPVTNQVDKLAQLAQVRAFVENHKLKIRDIGVPDKIAPILISSQTGLVGVPQITEVGLRVRILLINDMVLNAPVKVVSTTNKLANGDFYVYRMQFEIASRDTPFYWVLDLTTPTGNLGVRQ